VRSPTCFPEVLCGISKSRAASRKCRAVSETRRLLAENTAQHFKVANYFPKMLHGFSRRKAASGRCRAGFESRGLLPENAVRHLKVASFFPEMLRGPLIFRCPLSEDSFPSGHFRFAFSSSESE